MKNITAYNTPEAAKSAAAGGRITKLGNLYFVVAVVEPKEIVYNCDRCVDVSPDQCDQCESYTLVAPSKEN